MTSTGFHTPWCDTTCAAEHTGVHTSTPIPAADSSDLVGATITAERLTPPTPIPVICLTLTDDGQSVEYRFPTSQADTIAHALRQATSLLTGLRALTLVSSQTR